MSDLSLGGGGFPPNWGQPSPVYVYGEYRTDGLIWLGTGPATSADIEALYDVKPGAAIDSGTLVGTYAWDWISFSEKVILLQGGTPRRMGGIGSQVYEYQHVGGGDGVTFRKESEGKMWYINKAGDLVNGIPPDNAGAYHWVDVGGGYRDAHEGVEQGSAADQILGRGEFFWDESRRLYDVR